MILFFCKAPVGDPGTTLEFRQEKAYDDIAMAQTSLKSTPRDIFLYLLNILTFYVSVVSFITLWVQYVNALFPDRLNVYYPGVLDGILWSSSVLMVAIPARLVTSWLLMKDFAAHPEKRELAIRKWFIYFTLFVASVTIIGDLITIIYNFLKGELTLPFFLKIIVVLVVAAASFLYFLWDLRRDPGAGRRQMKFVMAAVLLALIGSIIYGFLIAGTPQTQRDRRMDEQRLNDLGMIQNQIISYWTQKNKLPPAIENLRDPIGGFDPPQDPQTHEAYEYRPTGPVSFELCASFATSQNEPEIRGPYALPRPAALGGGPTSFNWAHGAGRMCFSRSIDPDFYPKLVPKPAR
ncbi:MAG: hypothetical protein HY221_01025 [Candidatus Sungbacteria bacterium]|uniref:DUF5671 domain-containing protein n=1 Tax=Candidatus Sungiibacteriota bacterium TaxID=2750080 RepID=A0A932QXZ3_9BACT|nr:hypothetical protein [Candidatus Sungbacteria bacterium]